MNNFKNLIGDIKESERSRWNLHNDILIEILSRLPGSCLSRFRFVCKHWFTIITTDPLLADLHISRGFKSSHPSIITSSSENANGTWHLNLNLIDLAAEGSMRHVLILANQCKTSPSCNGLLCIYNHAFVALFNPTIQNIFVLPKPPTENISSKYFVGYLQKMKQYKVVRVSSPSWNTTYEVLTVGSTSWREIRSPYRGLFKEGLSINGVLYGIEILLEEAESEEFGIMSIDLNDEELRRIKFPKSLFRWDYMFDMNGCVCVVHYVAELVEIWMLEDISKHSWICRCTLKSHYEPILIHQGKVLYCQGAEGMHYRDIETGDICERHDYDKVLVLHGVRAHNESFVNLGALIPFRVW